MLSVKLIVVGSLKTSYFREAAAQYLKQLRVFGKVEVIEIPAESFSSEAKRATAQREESKKLLYTINDFPSSSVMLLDETGKEMDSQKFARFLGQHSQTMVFVIGGSYGFSSELMKMPFNKISLSQMTLPHELARVVFLEQLYRAATILQGKEYHH